MKITDFLENGQLMASNEEGRNIVYLDEQNNDMCAECAQKYLTDPDATPEDKPIAGLIIYNTDEFINCDDCNAVIQQGE